MAMPQYASGNLMYGERAAWPRSYGSSYSVRAPRSRRTTAAYPRGSGQSNTRSLRKVRTSDTALEQAQRRAIELDLEQKRLTVEAERRRLETETASRLQNQDDRNYWTYLTNKSALASKIGQHGANWTSGDEHMRDYLAVKLGLLKPIQRKVGR